VHESLWRMKVGIPKEIKNREYRLGAIPAGVHALSLRDVRLRPSANLTYPHVPSANLSEQFVGRLGAA
jgi:hypothetical protein